MCVHDTDDTLDAAEQAFLTRIAADEFPAHRLALRHNEDGITWALLTPRTRPETLPTVTICRVSPSIMVMLEDQHARRQFRALESLEAAVDFVHAVADHALLQAAGLTEMMVH